jgi:hypothetical protein
MPLVRYDDLPVEYLVDGVDHAGWYYLDDQKVLHAHTVGPYELWSDHIVMCGKTVWEQDLVTEYNGIHFKNLNDVERFLDFMFNFKYYGVDF